jgi:hypothetical protein
MSFLIAYLHANAIKLNSDRNFVCVYNEAFYPRIHLKVSG